MSILSFIKQLLPRIDKSTILEDLRITKKELEDNLISSYSDAATHFKAIKLKSDPVKDIANVFYRNYSLTKSNNSVNIVSEINSKLANLSQNIDYVESELEKLLERDIIKDGLTAKKAVLIRAATELSFITRFAMDLLDYIYVKEIVAINDERNLDVSNSQENNIAKKIANFGRLLAIYGDSPKSFKNEIGEIPDVHINENNYAALTATYGEGVIDPANANLVTNFVHNPIYHFRLMIAEWQSNRYKAYRDKKRMLELRLLMLQSYQSNNPDAKIEKEIEYLQNRIESIEYKMAKMES
jgi:hypothetical protein